MHLSLGSCFIYSHCCSFRLHHLGLLLGNAHHEGLHLTHRLDQLGL